ncbi:metalloregulator ArsR/SmtB family transcription factor [Streptomyces aurantiacus]|uniref:Putative HTH-type transcriptional regulator YuzN n=1 Tax=Streptomyces aurantiacus JA 4570 TaxID=1286094 RepID=S3ZEU6_9ACTN|nr:metalloregulator ArsR/SmtB family transcription factor [Streptomyces aurantiacus]EPH41648.1 putative HTH-type transcriptional regulator YuzN [Streptomyces aurantiacus JA 4570]
MSGSGGPGADGAEEPDLGTVLTALSDPTRRMILEHLAGAGRASATELADGLPVTRQAVLKHLKVLGEAGLVTSGRAGRAVLFEVRPGPLDACARHLADLASRWDRRLRNLKRRAEAAEGDATPPA